MGAEIDRLELQVEAQATKANNALDSLVSKLEKLEGSLKSINTSGLTGMSDGIIKFSQASSQLSNVKTTDFTRLVKNIEKLSAINTKELYGASHGMRTLVNAMNGFGSVSANSVGVADFANSISKLGGANVQKAITNLPALATAMNDLMGTLSKAPAVNKNIIEMTKALANLTSQGSRVGTSASSVIRNVNGVGSAMSTNARKARSFASALGSVYQSYFWLINGTKKLWNSIESSTSYVETLNYFDAAFGQVANSAVSQWKEAGYDSADAYYESFSSRAKELTSKMTGFTVNDDGTLTASGEASVGINPSKLMNYQATFAQMSSSMGVTSETSLMLSQALTEIGADLASVKNMDFDKVWTDMASGLAGMSRTLDKYGVNIRNVNLQQKLFDLGISENITNLNQNDKALLRAIILLDSTKYAWGDLANTLNQPANQMRLLESNISNLSRTLGNLFLPALSKVLPYVNGLVIAGQRLLTWVGSLMGIDLGGITSSIGSSEVDMSELLGDTEDLVGELGNASDEAKKLKNHLLGIDELNVISPEEENSTSGSGAGLSSGLLDDAFEDAFSEYQKAWDEAFSNMENRANKFADKFEKYLQPVKDIIEDFAVGDFLKAGEDTTKLATSIIDFLGNAIDDIDWELFGNKIGDYIEGIDWPEVVTSAFELKFDIWKAIAEAWFSSFDAAPIETAVLSGIALCKFTGAGDIIWTKLAASLGLAGGMSGIDKASGGFALAATVYVGFKFVEDANSWIENIKKYGWDEGRRKTAEENAANPYRNGTAIVQEDGSGVFDQWLRDLEEWQETNRKTRDQEKEEADLFWQELGTDISAWWDEDVSPWFTKEKWEELGDTAKISLVKKWDEFTFWWRDTGIPDWWDKNVAPWFTVEKWENLGDNFKTGLSNKWTEFNDWWETTGIPDWWDGNVTPWFTKERWEEFGENAKTGLSEKWGEFTDWWKTTGLYKWWTEDVEPFFDKDTWSWKGIGEGLEQAFDNAFVGVKGAWNSFATWLNDKLTFSWDSVSILGQEIIPAGNITLGVLPTFNTGGFPEDGLFMANHNELVGQFSNGKTAVANNEQIIEGISNGVTTANEGIIAVLLQQNELMRQEIEYLRSINEKEYQIGDTDVARANRRGTRLLGYELVT